MIKAQVIECHGRRVTLALADGGRAAAEVFGKRLRVVCGDWVQVEQAPVTAALHIKEVLPRQSHFTRTDSRGQPEVLAANITQLVVLMSDEPRSDPYIVDRYLAGAALGNLQALLVITKQELGLSNELQSHIQDYEHAGYRVMRVSALGHMGLNELNAALQAHTSMLVGESGVGKSSLTNVLLNTESQTIRALSNATGEGRHTTVSSALFNLVGGGALMDSPGVRDYAPAPVNDLQVAFGWREFTAYSGQCKFNNCLHLREPGCAILAAVDAGHISARRHDSYKRLVNLMRQLLPSYQRH